jgi:predicted ATPase
MASINLSAGKKCAALSDHTSALKFDEHGVSFLPSYYWSQQYDLSINLFDSAAEAACILGNASLVEMFSDKVISHATCFELRLEVDCLEYIAAFISS